MRGSQFFCNTILITGVLFLQKSHILLSKMLCGRVHHKEGRKDKREEGREEERERGRKRRREERREGRKEKKGRERKEGEGGKEGKR
jgi:hypothetical protein